MVKKLFITTLSVAFLITIVMLLKVLTLANVGVDLTDEGYYFNWISNPWLYQYYASQFGYIYHPIYKALGNSIVHLRQANMVISFGLSWLLSYFVLKQTLQNSSKALLITASASLALPALYILMITGHWVPSPSYNSLNFQGCLIVAIGFVFAMNQNTKEQIVAVILIGLGGWLVFMAKPSTALLLVIATALYFIRTIKTDWLILLGSGFVSLVLLFLTAYWLDGSATQFYKRYLGGLELMSTMGGGHGVSKLLKLDFFNLSNLFKAKFLLFLLVLVASLKVFNSKAEVLKTVLSIIVIVILVNIAVGIFNSSHATSKIPKYHTLIILALTFASIVIVTFRKKMQNVTPSTRLIVLFLIIPYLYAAGTNNNYWQTAAGASVFWVLAAILIFARVQFSQQALTVVVGFVVSVSVVGVFDSIQSPYRQTDAVLKQTATYIDPHTQQTLVLSNDTAKYLNTLKTVLQKANFKPNTPVIDLTGHHPGALYFMQAKAIGQAWTIGGYKGSVPLATMALYQASCHDVASAWLLIEKEGSRQIPHTVLNGHGILADKSTYKKIGKFNTQSVDDFGGRNNLHPDAIYEQFLLKPVDVDNQTQACLAYRKTHPSPFEQF